LPCRTVLDTAPVTGNAGKSERGVRDLRQRVRLLVEDATIAPHGGTGNGHTTDATDIVALLIVDEADRLRLQGLEQSRDIDDQRRVGLIRIGMPGLEQRMARYPQLYSRVGFVQHYRPLSGEELRFILEHKWEQLGRKLDPTDSTDAGAIAAITRITGGNFRPVQRLCAQIERILQLNELRTITGEVV